MALSLKRTAQKASSAVLGSAPARRVNTHITKGENVLVNTLTNRGPLETVATVFGSTSLVGPYICDRLARQGVTLALPYRDDYTKVRHNKIFGEIGQIALFPTDLFDRESVAKTLVNSNLAINLIGTYAPTIHYNLHDANVKTAHRVAKIAKESGVTRFIHFSALGAAADSPSEFLRVKHESELAVRDIFPQATIIRPAPMYNFDSRLICEMGRGAVGRLYICHGSDAQIQPVAAEDVSLAVQQIVMHPEIDGQTWELTGDTALTRGELAELVRLITDYKSAYFFNVPGDVSVAISRALDFVGVPKLLRPHALRTGRAEYDAQTLIARPNVGGSTYSPIKSLQDLGITPRPFKLGVLKALKPYLAVDAVAQSGVDGTGISKWRPHGKDAAH